MAGFVSPDKLEQIRSASDIVDIIGAAIPLKRAGANFVALCPFHKEKSPSFNVNPHRQIFHCFGCHKGGDVFTFVREYENLSFPEAIKRLADRASIPLEFENQPGQQQARHVKETLLQMHEQIAQRWQTALATDAAGQIARDYLTRRGVSDDAIKLFRLGYAPEAWDDTVNWAKSKGHELALVEQGGLIIRKEETDRYYDRFRGRLMFPICDEQGRIIGFSGRILSGDEKTAKYVNSPETPIFSKGKVFFGLDKSKRAILDAGFAIICEGQLDLIACYMSGVQNVVAPQGTAFTNQHASILKRYVQRIVLCFDSDNAGKNAAVRSLETLVESGPKLLVRKRDNNPTVVGRHTGKPIGDALPSGLAIGVAIIPPPHDPDSFIKEFGVESFRRLIDAAPDFFDYLLDRLCVENNLGTDLGRRTVLKVMRESLFKTNEQVVIDKYAQKTALRLGVSEEAVRADFRKGNARGSADVESEEVLNEPPSEYPPPTEREFWLLRFLLVSDEHLDWVARSLELNWIRHPGVRRAVSERLDAHRSNRWRGVPALIDDMDDAGAASLITRAVAEVHSTAELSRNLSETVRMLRSDFLDRQLAALKLRLSQPGLGDTEVALILREQAELRRLKLQSMSDSPPTE